jgi:hypothetical protein
VLLNPVFWFHALKVAVVAAGKSSPVHVRYKAKQKRRRDRRHLQYTDDKMAQMYLHSSLEVSAAPLSDTLTVEKATIAKNLAKDSKEENG